MDVDGVLGDGVYGVDEEGGGDGNDIGGDG